MLQELTVSSSFQLNSGYSLWIVDIPSRIVPDKLLKTHTEMTATRALLKILRSGLSRATAPAILSTGLKACALYESSRWNIPIQCLRDSVVGAKPHYVLWRRSKKRAVMKVTYKHLGLRFECKLASELSQGCLEIELQNDLTWLGEFRDDSGED